MVFFRKKEEDIKKTEKGIKEIKEAVEGREPVVEKEKPIEEPKKPAFAPLFVKIDRYKSVLNMLNDLKTTVVLVKNGLVVQKSIERLREENRNLIESGINKIDDKIISLDSEFMRPRGFKEDIPPMIRSSDELRGVVGELKTQIENLKSELKDSKI